MASCRTIVIAGIVLILLACSYVSTADVLTGYVSLTWDRPDLTASPGEKLILLGTIKNTSNVTIGVPGQPGALFGRSPVFLKGNALITLDTDPVPTWAWPDILHPGNAWQGTVCTLTVPLSSATGAYMCRVTVSYSEPTYTYFYQTNNAWFNLNVIPEPSTLLALLSGLAGLGGMARRRKS